MATVSSRPPEGTLAPLRLPLFRDVWLANLASNFGGLIQGVGASWLMTSLGTTTLVALVQASTVLPIMLFALIAGAMADNYGRREIMIAAQSFMLIVSAALALFAWLGWINPIVLLFFTFLIGIGTAFNGPAWQASVSEMVPRADLPGAVTLNSMGFNLARALGPAIGGAIVAAAGAALAFAVNAVSYVGLIAVLAKWHPELPKQRLPRETMGVALGAGLRYVAMSPDIRIVLLRGLLFGATASSVSALMPLVARDLVGGGALTYGLLLGAFGGGAVGGAFLNASLRRSFSAETNIRASCIVFGLATIAAGLSGWLSLTIVAIAFVGAGWVLVLSAFNVTVQMSAPRWVAGRAVAVYQMVTFGGMAVGSWLWGVCATDYGVGMALIVSGVITVASTVIGFRLRMPQPEQLNLDPLRPYEEPQIALDIQPRSGPIVISIEYEIDPEDVIDFLAAMAERRRIRRRDGARHWALLRDLADPKLWIERYQTPTWHDYLRHTTRITHADASIPERILNLHRGPVPPRVHRMIERQTGSLPPVPAPQLTEIETS